MNADKYAIANDIKRNSVMTTSYKGRHVTISYDETLCVHAGECVRGLPQVFSLGPILGSSLLTFRTKRRFRWFGAVRVEP